MHLLNLEAAYISIPPPIETGADDCDGIIQRPFPGNKPCIYYKYPTQIRNLLKFDYWCFPITICKPSQAPCRALLSELMSTQLLGCLMCCPMSGHIQKIKQGTLMIHLCAPKDTQTKMKNTVGKVQKLWSGLRRTYGGMLVWTIRPFQNLYSTEMSIIKKGACPIGFNYIIAQSQESI